MSKWTLVALCAALLLSCTQADAARVHRRHRPRETKIFAAKPWSVSLENEVANEMGAYRYFTQSQVNVAVLRGELVSFNSNSAYSVSPKLPENRRYALPNTVSFIESLALDFYGTFHQPLMVDSAIRAATTQRGLHLRSAAPAYGSRASSHERGTTADVSKHLTKAQHAWMIDRLLYYRALGQVLVIEERGCFHIFVRGDYGNSRN